MSNFHNFEILSKQVKMDVPRLLGIQRCYTNIYKVKCSVVQLCDIPPYLFVMSRELTYLYSPSYFCSVTVILPIGLLSRVRNSPDTSKQAIMLAGPCHYQEERYRVTCTMIINDFEKLLTRDGNYSPLASFLKKHQPLYFHQSSVPLPIIAAHPSAPVCLLT